MMTENITVTITTPSDREAVVTREFNAPAALVFEAVTKAELIKRWYGAAGSLDSCESDARVGGAWRFAFTVNGKQNSVESDPERSLLEVLREDLQLTGTKYGCGEGACGACTVLVNGKRTFSCSTIPV